MFGTEWRIGHTEESLRYVAAHLQLLILSQREGRAGSVTGALNGKDEVQHPGSATCSGTLANCTGQPTAFGTASEQLTVPLPSVGGYANYNITPRLMAQVRTDFVFLQVGTLLPARCSSSMRAGNIGCSSIPVWGRHP